MAEHSTILGWSTKNCIAFSLKSGQGNKTGHTGLGVKCYANVVRSTIAWTFRQDGHAEVAGRLCAD